MGTKFTALTLGASAAMFATVWVASAPPTATGPHPFAPIASAGPVASEPDVHYAGCNAVRATGKAPLYKGQPGYGEHMDGDGDGIACEDYR